jgi:hypothetical protein
MVIEHMFIAYAAEVSNPGQEAVTCWRGLVTVLTESVKGSKTV